MKLTESELRAIIRKELVNEMHIGSMKDKAIGTALTTLFGASPMILRAYLEANPAMMEKVQAFLHSLMEE